MPKGGGKKKATPVADKTTDAEEGQSIRRSRRLLDASIAKDTSSTSLLGTDTHQEVRSEPTGNDRPAREQGVSVEKDKEAGTERAERIQKVVHGPSTDPTATAGSTSQKADSPLHNLFSGLNMGPSMGPPISEYRGAPSQAVYRNDDPRDPVRYNPSRMPYQHPAYSHPSYHSPYPISRPTSYMSSPIPATAPHMLSHVAGSPDDADSSSALSHSRKRVEPHIPRPRNAFIFFRSEMIKSNLIPSSVEPDHRNLSRIAGEMWRKLSDTDRKKYNEMARVEKEEHKAKYPKYRYTPAHRATPREGTEGGKRKVHRRPETEKLEKQRSIQIASLISEGLKGEELEKKIREEGNYRPTPLTTPRRNRPPKARKVEVSPFTKHPGYGSAGYYPYGTQAMYFVEQGTGRLFLRREIHGQVDYVDYTEPHPPQFGPPPPDLRPFFPMREAFILPGEQAPGDDVPPPFAFIAAQIPAGDGEQGGASHISYEAASTGEPSIDPALQEPSEGATQAYDTAPPQPPSTAAPTLSPDPPPTPQESSNRSSSGSSSGSGRRSLQPQEVAREMVERRDFGERLMIGSSSGGSGIGPAGGLGGGAAGKRPVEEPDMVYYYEGLQHLDGYADPTY